MNDPWWLTALGWARLVDARLVCVPGVVAPVGVEAWQDSA